MGIDLIILFKNDEEEAFRYVYQNFKAMFIGHYSSKYRLLNTDDIKDIFQDSIIILYDNVLKGKIIELENPKAYIFRIGQLLIYDKIRAKKKIEENETQASIDNTEIDLAALDFLYDHNQNKVLQNNLNLLGEKCRKIIIAFYYKNLSFGEIANQYNYSSANTVKSQKHKCIKQLRNKFNYESV